jgi:GT2 family glycosyltransferase
LNAWLAEAAVDLALSSAVVLAAVWVYRTAELVNRLPEVADLTEPEWDLGPAQMPSLVVVVPAKDEAENLRATLDALAAQMYPRLRVMVVDDRSTDATGAIAEEYAARYPERIEALHVVDLPEGWMGKTWAMEAATQQCREVDYLLFTDADVLLSPSVVMRALAYAEETEADHVVVMPTPQVKTRGEGIVLGFFVVFATWASRPWRVAEPLSRRDTVGVGAFNLVRRESFDLLGGWFPQRLAVAEDVTLGLRFKAAEMRQRVAFAPHHVLVHWAPGMRGIIRVLTKNIFSAVNFNPLLLLGGVAWIFVFFVMPVIGLFWWVTLIPCLLVMLAIAVSYREMGRASGMDARYGWLFPAGAAALMFAMLRSMVVVMARRGVVWRGTFYGLGELRRHNSPFQWERAAAALREEQRRAAPSRLRQWVDRAKSRR